MKKLLFAAATMIVAVSPAFAMGNGIDDGDCKWCSNRENSTPIQPKPSAACHRVRERIETRKDHVVYRTRQVCA
jgi:hypothetical protein